MVSRLFTEDTLEHAIAFAGDAVVTWTLIVMFLHCVVAVTLRAVYFPLGNWTFLGEVFHGMVL